MSLPRDEETRLSVATMAEAPVLANLLELYAHDLSDAFALDVGPDGRFGYPKLALYWPEPERRSAFLVHRGARLAGFALVTRGSPASDDPACRDVAEFFVLRRHRRSGVGREAARALFQRCPGPWTVRVSEGNPRGRAFWSTIIREFAGETLSESARPGSPHAWRVFSFVSPA